MNEQRKKQNKTFLFAWCFLAFGLFVRYYEAWATSYNTTILALNYDYGFTSRALLGTVFRAIGNALGIEVYTYAYAMRFYEISTVLFYFLFLVVIMLVLNKVSDEVYKESVGLIIIFTIVTIPMFATRYNFGRVDIYMLAMTLLGVVAFLKEKMEWVIIPLSALGVMFHQGYVFMFYNILLVLLLYKAITSDTKRRRKYLAIFVVSLIICSALFLWFQVFFRGGNGEQFFDEVVKNAKGLGIEGEYHLDLIRAELLGVDLSADEAGYKKGNHQEIIVFSILMLPYIIGLVSFFKGMVKAAGTKWEKLKYLLLGIGAFTMLPDFMFKVDYGRWTYAVFAYYLMTILALLAFDDKLAKESLKKTLGLVKSKGLLIALVAYPLVFMPFEDILISRFTDHICIALRAIF